MTNPRLNSLGSESCLEPFTGALELLSESLEAQSVAIFLVDLDASMLDLIASKSGRKDFVRTSRRPLGDSLIRGVVQRGLTVSEAVKPEAFSKLGLYASNGPEIIYLGVPFGKNGLVWVDREGTERFTPDQIKLASMVAVMVSDIMELYAESNRTRTADNDLQLLTSLADGTDTAIDTSGMTIDSIVSRMTQSSKCDGALAAISTDNGEMCRIVSVSGFTGALNRGKVVRLRQGWAKWAIEKMRPAVISGLKGDETSLPIFHAGEAIGFAVKSLAVIPWYGFDQVDGILIAASRSSAPEWESRRSFWMFLASIVGLIRRLEISGKVLKSVRRYDGESGVMSEGYFRSQLRSAFDRQSDGGGAMFVLIAKITNLDKLYLDHEFTTINRFLGLFCEKLCMSTKRQTIAGKLSTGCFCIGVENLPSSEVDTLLRKAKALVGQGITNVDGIDIRHEVALGSALFPHDCKTFPDMLTSAMNQLLSKKPGRRLP